MRKFVLYTIIVFQILLIASLVRGIQLSRQSKTRIANLQETKKQLQDEQGKLREMGEYYQSTFYLEKVARDEMNLSKPGESVVIVPESIILGEGNSNQESVISREKENWQKWWEVLTGSDWKNAGRKFWSPVHAACAPVMSTKFHPPIFLSLKRKWPSGEYRGRTC